MGIAYGTIARDPALAPQILPAGMLERAEGGIERAKTKKGYIEDPKAARPIMGSMIIANAMNACAQAMERFRADVLAHVGQIETGLSLGADPETTVAPYVQSAVYASLLPRLDMLKSLGLVWIPGVMAGMLVSGASPVYAGIFQFIIVAMILSASGIAGLVATLLMRAQAFSSAAQLEFRPGIPGSDAHAKPALLQHHD